MSDFFESDDDFGTAPTTSVSDMERHMVREERLRTARRKLTMKVLAVSTACVLATGGGIAAYAASHKPPVKKQTVVAATKHKKHKSKKHKSK